MARMRSEWAWKSNLRCMGVVIKARVMVIVMMVMITPVFEVVSVGVISSALIPLLI